MNKRTLLCLARAAPSGSEFTLSAQGGICMILPCCLQVQHLVSFLLLREACG